MVVGAYHLRMWSLLPLLSAHIQILVIDATPPSPLFNDLQELVAEMHASATYTTTTLAEGRDNARPALEKVATHSGDLIDVGEDLQVDNFEEDTDICDISINRSCSLVSMLELLENITIDAVVKVRSNFAASGGHIVVLGPDGFHLCSCLALFTRGMPCRHFFAAILFATCRKVWLQPSLRTSAVANEQGGMGRE